MDEIIIIIRKMTSALPAVILFIVIGVVLGCFGLQLIIDLWWLMLLECIVIVVVFALIKILCNKLGWWLSGGAIAIVGFLMCTVLAVVNCKLHIAMGGQGALLGSIVVWFLHFLLVAAMEHFVGDY